MFKNIILIFFLAILGAGLLGGLYFWNQVSLPVSSSEDELIFTIAEGQGVKEIAANLDEQGIIRSAWWFETYVFLDKSESKFIAGDYGLRKNMNIKEMVQALTGGSPPSEEAITIKEGWKIADIADYLQEKGVVTKEDFTATALTTDTRNIIPDKQYTFLADKPSDQGLEGFLFPDTYRIFKSTTSAEIIERQLNNFGVKFTDQMVEDAAADNMNIYQIVTLASILEKEIKIKRIKGQPINNDLNVAAGVFYNRLNSGVALQSDATVNYVTGGGDTQPSSSDIKVDSLYNTYKYKGLPPGPICNPSIDAIKAAIYPEKTDYFYFLTKPDDTTVFSKTYEEHLQNKKKYLD
ncbi:MAG: endolytic transglycosylase MltG [Patescibacteria group bacterium]|jgi:UPF0755 protein